ncbi:MAG TPA: bifunctional 4-hydroxy-2-oxoglutarate aldolase/2-dehydro-3-deoxy-phosphogluconate aldolase [Geminicoccaceae bacterium]|nr:bifunctional 4-hydroxy-2-oxoglutarate aldolase/2-dehydro-3-deoxy-phosphogluconate aldolase [Geminicoccaceae bacterium]
MAARQPGLHDLLSSTPVVPVLVVDSVRTALPLAQALIAGGLSILEITLRTPAALEIIRALAGEIEHAVVGAGTVLTPAQYEEAAAAGAKFVVSPGATAALLDVAAASSVPFLPAAATSSEVMRLLERGYGCLKFFPAEPAGGTAYLKALAAPLPDARFCPTGGIDAARAPSYLALPNVVCVGGSWVAPPDAIAAADWPAITRLARAAAALRPAARTGAQQDQ